VLISPKYSANEKFSTRDSRFSATLILKQTCITDLYRWRHLVENFFCALKALRRIATRYEKTDACFAAMVNLVATVLRTR
jgi:transposase